MTETDPPMPQSQKAMGETLLVPFGTINCAVFTVFFNKTCLLSLDAGFCQFPLPLI